MIVTIVVIIIVINQSVAKFWFSPTQIIYLQENICSVKLHVSTLKRCTDSPHDYSSLLYCINLKMFLH